MRGVAMTIALAVALLSPAVAPAQSWQEYRPDGIGFRIEMPDKPKIGTNKTRAGQTAYTATVEFNRMAFLAIYGAKTGAQIPADATLDAIAKGMAEGKKFLRFQSETIDGNPARRFQFAYSGNDTFELRIVIVDTRMIQAIFIGPADHPVGKHYLDSLAIVGK